MGADLYWASKFAAEERGHQAVKVARELYQLAARPDCPVAIGGELLRMARELGFDPAGGDGPERFGP